MLYSSLVGAWLRTAVFTILVPGTVVVLIPHTRLPRTAQWHAGALGIFAAILALARAAIYFGRGFWAFAAAGSARLYREMRNPIYAGVGSILAAEAIGFRSSQLAIYSALSRVCVNLFVLFYEELILRRKFGGEYEPYCRRVPCWLPRLNG